MARTFNLSIYGDDTLKTKFDHIKQYYAEKNPGIPLSDSVAGAIMIDEAYQKILGAQTNANRITTIIERLDSLEQVVKELVDVVKGSAQ